MTVLSIAIFSGEIRFSVLGGAVTSPCLVDKKRLVVKDCSNVSESMDWFESVYVNELNRVKPDKVVCKLNLGVDKKQSITQIMPLGVLALASKKAGVPFDLFTQRQFSPSKLSLAKGTDLYQVCDTIFGINKPYWDKKQKDSVIGGWMSL